ncbi:MULTISPECIES: helix-turn-helix domain-containing protein [Enterobacter]|uniref:helix-turn-helix domain-containing protein n=1 Tax=Enterobacter TaxID=547 RepID=UPI001F406204|nr:MULTISPECIES: helix-turn-helix domain-containing protein [Enterobacter]MCK7251698.1 helix-turn-helix domain-containing protein [Enterobacter kobei]MCK7434425.1 helix-turn-helix domain-containing protein [Enterobacter bugandensis]HCM9138191.1 helix-turn-helix domain-containing protein [Enterobacter cloacae subsp. cloacae]
MTVHSTDNESNDENGVPTPPAKAKSSRIADEKWGKDVMQAGFCIIPSLLLRCQQRLGLNPTQLAVLLQLADFWWEASRKPYPSKQTLSDRLGLSTRQIQRYMAELEQAGLLTRNVRSADNNGKLSNEYDLSGLVKKLKELAPEVLKAKEDNKQVTRKGGLKK